MAWGWGHNSWAWQASPSESKVKREEGREERRKCWGYLWSLWIHTFQCQVLPSFFFIKADMGKISIICSWKGLIHNLNEGGNDEESVSVSGFVSQGKTLSSVLCFLPKSHQLHLASAQGLCWGWSNFCTSATAQGNISSGLSYSNCPGLWVLQEFLPWDALGFRCVKPGCLELRRWGAS